MSGLIVTFLTIRLIGPNVLNKLINILLHGCHCSISGTRIGAILDKNYTPHNIFILISKFL